MSILVVSRCTPHPVNPAFKRGRERLRAEAICVTEDLALTGNARVRPPLDGLAIVIHRASFFAVSLEAVEASLAAVGRVGERSFDTRLAELARHVGLGLGLVAGGVEAEEADADKKDGDEVAHGRTIIQRDPARRD
jgi:hypothetical protein